MFFKKKNHTEKLSNSEVKSEKVDESVENKDVDESIKSSELVKTPDNLSRGLKWRLYLTGYGYAICSFVIVFLIAFCSNIFTGFISVEKKFNKLSDQMAFGDLSWIKQDEEFSEDEIEYDSENTIQTLSAVSDDFKDETYRFVFKDKNFPKISETYPVYKKVGPYIRNKKALKNWNSLKLGDYNLKNFGDLELSHFTLVNSDDSGYRIMYEGYGNSLSIDKRPGNLSASKVDGELPKEKIIKKNVEKILKSMDIKIDNVLEPVLNWEDFLLDGVGLVSVNYPQIINGKELIADGLDSEFSPVYTYVGYDFVNDDIIKVGHLDVAKFEVSDYLSNDIEDIKSKFENGGMYFKQQSLHENSTNVLVNNIRIAYMEMYNLGDSSWYYIPVVVGEVSTNIENYNGPKYVYQTIVS